MRRRLVVFHMTHSKRNHIHPGDEREKMEKKRIEGLVFEGSLVQQLVRRCPTHEMREGSMEKQAGDEQGDRPSPVFCGDRPKSQIACGAREQKQADL
jgi:hypothetical protein